MKTNFIGATKKIILWNDQNAVNTYTKLFVAGFSAFLSLPLINRLKHFSGFEEISMVAVGLLIFKYLLPKFNKDSLSIWTLIYGYLALVLLIFPSANKTKAININGTTN